MKLLAIFFIFLSLIALCSFTYAAGDDGEIRYDYVTDTAKSIVNKASALLTGELDIQAGPQDKSSPKDYTRDAIGRRVPKSTSVNAAGSLHSDQPL